MKKQLFVLATSALLMLGACSTHRQCNQTRCDKHQQKEQAMRETPAYFAFDSSVLTMEDRDNLDEIAKRLMDNPKEKVKICGFTDITGPKAYNQELSVRRAESAAKYLEWKGIAADRITTKGYGATHFAEQNTTASGRAKNRRIEVSFM